MEKDKIFIWILILFILIPKTIEGDSFKIPTLGKAQYVDMIAILEKFPDLEFKEKPAILIAEIHGNGKTIRIRSGSSFYTLGDKIQKISAKVVFSKNRFYLPPDVVEAILIHLINYEVFYQYNEDGLTFEVKIKNFEEGHLPIRAIVIDPGHGGKDPGTCDSKGNKEKDISLQVALGLEKVLKLKYPELLVYLTRNSDEYIPLENRSELANRLLRDTKEAVFISIHLNSSLSPTPSGYEIYYLSQTPTTESDREVALRENKILDSNYPSPIPAIQRGMLSSLSQRRSRNLAIYMEREFERGIGKLIPSRGVKKANFSVLRGSLMPAVLIEMGYLSHPKEAVFLNSSKVQKKIIESIVKGIATYGEAKD